MRFQLPPFLASTLLTATAAATLGVPSTSNAQVVVPLGDEFGVNTYTTGRQASPSVAMDRNGTFVVVWESRSIDIGIASQDGSASGMFGRLYDSTGTATSDEFQVNSFTPQSQSNGRVHMPPGGGSFVVLYNGYNEQDGDRSGVFARTFVGTTPQDTDDIQVNSYTTGFQLGGAVVFVDDNEGVGSNLRSRLALPSAAFDSVVVYSGPLAGDPDSGIGARRTQSTGPGGPNEDEFLVNSFTTGEQGDADACAAANGDFVVVWNSDGEDGDGLGMFARQFDSDANPIGAQFQVNSHTTGSQAFGRVCCAADGRFTVGWTDLDGLDGQFSGVFARQFDASGRPLSDQFQVNTFTSSSQTLTSIACNAAGETVVVWQSLGRQMSARAYDAAGAALGDEFEVSAFDVGVPQHGAAAMSENGTFVVAWYKRNADGDHDGVQARLFALATATTTSSTMAPAPACGDPIPNTPIITGASTLITASDALFVLRAGVGLQTCASCVCDVDGSGVIAATDALIILGVSVGVETELACPAC